MAIRCIACRTCHKSLGWFDDQSGCIVKPKPVPGTKVFGIYFFCECGHTFRFDGIVLKKRGRQTEFPLDPFGAVDKPPA